MAGGEEAGEEVEGDDGGPQEAGRAEEGVLRTHCEPHPLTKCYVTCDMSFVCRVQYRLISVHRY